MKIVKTAIRLVVTAVLYVIYIAVSAIVSVLITVLPVVMGLLCAISRDALNDIGRDGDSIALDCAKTFMQSVNRLGQSVRNILIHFGKF